MRNDHIRKSSNVQFILFPSEIKNKKNKTIEFCWEELFERAPSLLSVPRSHFSPFPILKKNKGSKLINDSPHSTFNIE
jgi:hypothetical protein